MFKKFLITFLLFSYLLMADSEHRISNTNFTISEDSTIYNYDRLRFRLDYTEGNYFGTFIADGVNYYGSEYIESNVFFSLKQYESDTPFSTRSSFYNYDGGSAYAKIYRIYGGYEDEKNRILAGLINVPIGVGRIWTPSNIFNPKNSFALESDEVFGVFGVLYTKHLSDTSHLSIVTSQKADHSFKYAAIYKMFIGLSEIGVNIVSSNDTKMISYEIEANLFDTGVEVRSEGAYVKNTFSDDKEFFQAIFGADYGFVNGVSVIGEILYSSDKFSKDEQILNLDSEIYPNLVGSHLYTALSLSYSFNIFLDGSLLYIESFNEKNSRFISPSLRYTLNDYNSFTLGAMLYKGSKNSEFENLQNSYYLKWFFSF